MPAPTPYILVHSPTAGPSATVITRLGLLPENLPILINSVRARASMEKDTLQDWMGDLAATGWGNRKLVYDLSLDQTAQYGPSDHYLGRIDQTLLQNLVVNFGMKAGESGVALLTQASRDLAPAKLAKVSLTIEVEDTRNASLGSPDGASTPAWGGTPAGTAPTMASSATATGTIGVAFSHTVATTGGTAPITRTLAPGHALPLPLVLNPTTGAITGTPTGAASDNYVQVNASNAYGTTSQILHIVIAAAPVPAAPVAQAYVRYLVDSGAATVLDGFWALGYGGMTPDPTNLATFLAGTPTTVDSPATDPGLPANPNALTGTIGARAWQITEVLGLNASDEYEYWYQRTPDDTALLDAVNAGADVITYATEEYTMGEDIGTVGPGDPAPSAWPGVIEPSDRISQYFAYKDYTSGGEVVVGGYGGARVYANLATFLAAHPWMATTHTETTPVVLLELYNVTPTPAYLYQQSTGDTRIATALAANDSPVYEVPDARAGGLDTTLPETTPAFALVGLPSPPSTNSGPAPDALGWLYVLQRNWGDGSLFCWGLRGNVPAEANFSFARLLQLYRELRASRPAHDELTYGHNWIEEVWASFDAGATWEAHWLDATQYPSAPTGALVGGSLADGVSPINNPLIGPGLLFADAVTEW